MKRKYKRSLKINDGELYLKWGDDIKVTHQVKGYEYVRLGFINSIKKESLKLCSCEPKMKKGRTLTRGLMEILDDIGWRLNSEDMHVTIPYDSISEIKISKYGEVYKNPKMEFIRRMEQN